MSLYQEMRPSKFEDMLGNVAPVRALQKQVRLSPDKRVHAYMFVGPVGCGKTTLARILSNKFGADDNSIFELNAARTRGIDTVRDLVSTCHVKTLNGRAKIYIIDESHQLTKPAQEAFLKPLEDIPEHVYFIFCTTNPENLLPAIRDRCQPGKYQVKPLKREEMGTLLERACKFTGIAINPDILGLIPRLSAMCPRNALGLFESIMHLDDDLDKLDVLEYGTEVQPEIMELSKILIQSPERRIGQWPKAIQIIKQLSLESEPIRRAVLGFLAYKMDRCTDTEIMEDYVYVTRKLGINTLYHGKAMLMASVFEACIGKGRNYGQC